MSGALMSLVAVGAQNTYIPKNLSIDYENFDLVNLTQSIVLQRSSDLHIPEYIKFSFASHPDQSDQANQMDELKAQLKKINMVLEIGGGKIANFPLELLIELNEPIICESKVYVNLCFDKILGDIKLIGLQYHEVRFRLVIWIDFKKILFR